MIQLQQICKVTDLFHLEKSFKRTYTASFEITSLDDEISLYKSFSLHFLLKIQLLSVSI